MGVGHLLAVFAELHVLSKYLGDLFLLRQRKVILLFLLLLVRHCCCPARTLYAYQETYIAEDCC